MYDFRAFDRQSVDGKIGYVLAGERNDAQVLDMSCTGCRLSLAGEGPEEGACLQLVLLEDLEVSAVVMWTDGDTIGVRFVEPVIDAVVRYFGMSGRVATPADVTRDSFGRTLPPLGQGNPRR